MMCGFSATDPSDPVGHHVKAIDDACALWQYGAVGRNHTMSVTLAFKTLPTREGFCFSICKALNKCFATTQFGGVGNVCGGRFGSHYLRLVAEPSKSSEGGVFFKMIPREKDLPREQVWREFEMSYLEDFNVNADAHYTQKKEDGSFQVPSRVEMRFQGIDGHSLEFPSFPIGKGGLVKLIAKEGCPRVAMFFVSMLARHRFEECAVVEEVGFPKCNGLLEYTLLGGSSHHIQWMTNEALHPLGEPASKKRKG